MRQNTRLVSLSFPQESAKLESVSLFALLTNTSQCFTKVWNRMNTSLPEAICHLRIPKLVSVCQTWWIWLEEKSLHRTHSSDNCGSTSQWLYEALLLHTWPRVRDLTFKLKVKTIYFKFIHKDAGQVLWASLFVSLFFCLRYRFMPQVNTCDRFSFLMKSYRRMPLKDGEPHSAVKFIFYLISAFAWAA